MHNAFYRRVREVTDRIGAFFFAAVEYGYIRDELPRDWIRRVVRIDEVDESRRDRHGVTGGNGLKFGPSPRRGQSCVNQIRRCAQGLFGGFHGLLPTCRLQEAVPTAR